VKQVSKCARVGTYRTKSHNQHITVCGERGERGTHERSSCVIKRLSRFGCNETRPIAIVQSRIARRQFDCPLNGYPGVRRITDGEITVRQAVL